MVNAYIENSYKLVFPLLCEGYLNLDYDVTGEIQHSSTVESTGVLVNGAINDNSTTNIVVDTVDATTKFEIGDNVYDAANALVGVVSAVTATQITLAANNDEALANNENLKKNITTTTTLRDRGIWAHDSNFVLEAIITPYDVNGAGSRTSGRHGVLDSQKTPPYPSDAYGDRSGYESVDYLGASAYLTQKMMLFHNTNLKLYLQNTTSSSYNQPAEYKVVAELTKGGTTKTIQSDTVIKAVDSLHGYYDASGYYNGLTTKYQRIATNATASNPSGTATIDDYDDLERNTQATGQIVVSGTPTHFSTAVNATGSVTIANENNFKVDVAPSVNVANSGQVKFGAIPDSATDSDLTEYIQVTNEDGTVVTRWFAVDGATNGDELTGGSWPSNSYSYARSTTDTVIANNFAISINRYNAGWSGSASSGSDPTDTQASPPSICTLFTGGIAGSTPNRKCAEADITLGSGLPAGITRIQPAGGTNEIIRGESTGSADSDINYISITDSAGTTKNYMPSETKTTGTTGTRTLDDSSTVSVVYFNWGGNSQESNCAEALKEAINHANGHPSTITATRSGAVVNLSHDIIGTAGNSATIAKTNTANSAATISGANFTGGVNLTNNSNTPYIQLIDGAGSAVTKKYVPVRNGDAIATGATQTIGDVSGAVAFQVGANDTATAANLETAIEHANGHNGSISVSNSSGTLTLTQSTSGAGSAGNTAITQNNLANVGDTDFSGGGTPDNYISITDAGGTLKKYKASTTEVTGTTDGTYTFFRAVTNNNTTAANLETAIDGNNGHNGTLITSRTNAVVTITLNQAAMGSAALTNNVTDVTTVNFQSGSNTNIVVGSGEATELGAGSKIYDSSTTLLGTVASVSGDTITLAEPPTSTVTSTIYTNQLREAFYVEQVYCVALVYNDTTLELYLNGELIKRDTHTLTSFKLDKSDCKIGRGANNAEQFFGELYEIAMHKGKRPSPTQKTLTPGYSDIMFYYTFGG
tara:strand:+ start:2566 stop:5532 length:2967 start_codon:yes stop_codon:yes gene_type:complete